MLSQITRAIPNLSRAEKRVATWVLEHPKQATSATLAHIASECGTSEPTVLRFCRRMGLRGFRELGVRLAESLSVPGSYVHRDVNLSLIHISEPTRRATISRMPSSA